MAGYIGGYIQPQGGGQVGTGGIVSGKVASGSLDFPSFASGAKIDSAEWLIDDSFTTAEIISGATFAVAVAFTQSGTLQTAMASVSGRMPTVGVVIANVASGVAATVYRAGRVFSAAFNFSGWMNQPIYVGRSGQLSASGAPTSSGDIQQIIGVSVNQSGLLVQIGDPLEGVIAGSGDVGSGAITGQAGGGFFCLASGTVTTFDLGSGSIVSGLVASGQLGVFHFSSGLVTSGLYLSGSVGSGAITGRAGGGYFCVASGTVTTNDLGSGSIVSGLIASGQVGRFHIASGQLAGFELGSGSIVSGRVASGQVGVNHLSSGLVSGVMSSGSVGSGSVTGQAGGGFFCLASGTITSADLASGAVKSGQIASGTIITYTRNVLEDTYLTGETVSGLCPVTIGSGDVVLRAQGASGLRMPAIGVANSNALSGTAVQVVLLGRLPLSSGLFKLWSGIYNDAIYVSTSGDLMTITEPNAGLTQIIGLTVSGGLYVLPSLITASGGALIQSGIL